MKITGTVSQVICRTGSRTGKKVFKREIVITHIFVASYHNNRHFTISNEGDHRLLNEEYPRLENRQTRLTTAE